MLPRNAISVVPVFAQYLAPDSVDTQELQSLEQGGTALNDPSQGRQVKTWRAYISGPTIKVEPLVAATPTTTLVSGAVGALTSVSLAFDASMQPTICYIEAGLVKLRWYNTVSALFQTDSYAGVTSARVSTDDKRKTQEGVSDVVFAYVRGDVLYYRLQRDRYTVEYTVGPAVKRKLSRVGVTTNLRLQFELQPV